MERPGYKLRGQDKPRRLIRNKKCPGRQKSGWVFSDIILREDAKKHPLPKSVT